MKDGLEEIFAPFGGVTALIPEGAAVYIKPNLVHYSPETYTDIKVMEALLAYLSDHGFSNIRVMENVTSGNLSRLVFHVTGYTRLCRRYKARPLFLDEGPTMDVTLRGENAPTRIPRRLHEELIAERSGRFYLSLPKLKTHSMSVVTLGIKNQMAFISHEERMKRHNHQTLHHRLAGIYDLISPDFCIIEGLTAVINGHFPITAYLEESVLKMGLLIGGRDTLAVDMVGAKVLGYGIEEVAHLRLAAEWGLGAGALNEVEVIGEGLERFTKRHPYELLGRYNPEVTVIEGRARACAEGCKGNSLCIQEMLYNDFQGKGGWTLVFGKDIDKSDVAEAFGPILVVGPCAVGELRDWLKEKFPVKKMYFIEACNDLKWNTTYQARLSKLKPINMVPANPVVAAWLLLIARLRGSKARLPPLLG